VIKTKYGEYISGTLSNVYGPSKIVDGTWKNLNGTFTGICGTFKNASFRHLGTLG
jgi:hypothetical protein